MPWPHSLLERNLLLLILVVVASQLTTFMVFFVFMQQPRIDEAASLIASQTATVERLLTALHEPERGRAVAAMNGGGLATPMTDSHELPRTLMARRFLISLRERLPSGTQVRWEDGEQRRIWLRLEIDGTHYWIVLSAPPTIGRLLPWSIVCMLLAFGMFPALGAWLIQRDTSIPLQRLVRAAATVERGAWPDAVPADGPTELATVADAFNRMVASLAEMDATRAEMLAGISHDIRTPLTKLRMAIAAPEAFDAPAASAERFVAEIDAIVEQFIDFARGWDSEQSTPGDLNALIEQLAADYAGLGHTFELSLEPLPEIAFRPVGMLRLLMNLMHNATVYGRVGLAVRTHREPGFVVVGVEDAGPGVPEAMLTLLKRPFRRVEQEGRPRGTGLGLAIAERIARQHGGRLDLALRSGGGLSATVRLPVS
ncbi:ATP-binding protein [Trinickia fusca]|nr:ATP-binding protein [Trinickia fusca]